MASMSPHLGRVLLEYGRWHWVTPVVVGGGLGGGGLRCAPWGLARGSFGSWCLLVRFGSACCLCVCVFVFVFAFGVGLGQSPLYHILVLYTCQESADRSKYRHVYHRDYDKHSTGFVFRHSSQDPVAELFN
jgi:hypothetical protein